jgi:hypothetical protein
LRWDGGCHEEDDDCMRHFTLFSQVDLHIQLYQRGYQVFTMLSYMQDAQLLALSFSQNVFLSGRMQASLQQRYLTLSLIPLASLMRMMLHA